MPRRLAITAIAICVAIVLQIALGGLVAGLKAGLVYDTWPLIDGAFIPAARRLFFLDPVWSNFLDNHLTVQFVHRMVAYGLLALAALHAADALRNARGARNGAALLALLVLVQAILGILTLLWNVPVSLALAHQLVAFLLLMLATAHAQRLGAAYRSGRQALSLTSDRLRAA